jgi:two-component system CheB/CheR fusion protein
MLERVFEPFTQGDQGLARSSGGLGLGLALVKALVELHGGTVAAASAGPGRGTAVTLRIPALPPAAALLAASGPEGYLPSTAR